MQMLCGGFVVEVLNSLDRKSLIYPLKAAGERSPIMGPCGWFFLSTKDNTAHWVLNKFLKPIEADTFELGDIVRAVQDGNKGFIGEVVAFEMDGRVVCKSYNERTPSRCRYSYRPEELAKIHKVESNSSFAVDVDGQMYMRF